jgi:hypothetical protein
MLAVSIKRPPGSSATWTLLTPASKHVILEPRLFTGFSNNDPVGLVADPTGDGRVLTSSGSARPVFKTGGLNGQPYLLFDGVDDVLSTVLTLNTLSVDRVSILALVENVGVGDTILIEHSPNYNLNTAFVVYRTSSNRYAAGRNGLGNYTVETAVFASGTQKMSFTQPGGGGFVPVVNGDTTSNIISGGGAAGNYQNDTLYIGARGSGGFALSGRVYVIGLYTDALTATDLTGFDAHCLSVYGV